MAISQLKEIFDSRNVKFIAMVDDVFDSPSPEGLSTNQYHSFRDRFAKDEGLRRAVAWVSGHTLDTLPPQPDDLDDNQVDALWQSTWRPRVGGRKIKQIYQTALSDLFREHQHNLLAMLDEVVALYLLFHDKLARTVTVHGTDFDPRRLARAHIIVLDFFLGQNLTIDQAFERASQVVKNTINVSNRRSRAAPSFLLVSSRPTDIDIGKFRESAELMTSRFRFFSKESLRTPSTENMANLYDLVAASDRTSVIEELLNDWCKGAENAIQHVRRKFLSLEVSDLTYLDCFRLSHEGTSVPNYLNWFLSSLLNANVASKLTPQIWIRAAGMRFADVFDSDGNLDPESLMATFDGPTDAIAHAYCDIIFDNSRDTTKRSASPTGPLQDLMEGDLFVRPTGKRRNKLANAHVFLVLTPGCDLRVRAGRKTPSADAVTLLPGVLTPTLSDDETPNFAEGSFVRLLHLGKSHLFRVDWDYNRPTSMDWSVVATKGPGPGYRRLGRIRELYFHKIRDDFLSRLARIGTEVPPLLPHALAGEVYVSVGTGQQRRQIKVMSFARDDEYLWEIGPVRKNLRSTSTAYFYQVSRQFLKSLLSTLREPQDEDTQVAQAYRNAADRLGDLRTFLALVRPLRPGRRGASQAVEIKKPATRSKADTNSHSPLSIITFRD